MSSLLGSLSVPLISVFYAIPYSSDYCSLAKYFEIRKRDASSFVLFFPQRIVLAIQGFLWFHTNVMIIFLSFREKCHWTVLNSPPKELLCPDGELLPFTAGSTTTSVSCCQPGALSSISAPTVTVQVLVPQTLTQGCLVFSSPRHLPWSHSFYNFSLEFLGRNSVW